MTDMCMNSAEQQRCLCESDCLRYKDGQACKDQQDFKNTDWTKPMKLGIGIVSTEKNGKKKNMVVVDHLKEFDDEFDLMRMSIEDLMKEVEGLDATAEENYVLLLAKELTKRNINPQVIADQLTRLQEGVKEEMTAEEEVKAIVEAEPIPDDVVPTPTTESLMEVFK